MATKSEASLSDQLPEAEQKPSEEVEQPSKEEATPTEEVETEKPEGEVESEAEEEEVAALEKLGQELDRRAQGLKDKELGPIHQRLKELEVEKTQGKVEQLLQAEWSQGANYIQSLETSEMVELEKMRADLESDVFNKMQAQLVKNQQDRRTNVKMSFDLHKQGQLAAESRKVDSAWSIGRRYDLTEEEIAEVQKLGTDTERELKAELLQTKRQMQEKATAKAKVDKTPQSFAVGVEGKTSTGDEAFVKMMANPDYMPTEADWERYRKIEEKYK